MICLCECQKRTSYCAALGAKYCLPLAQVLISEDARQQLVKELMDARRAVKGAKGSGEPSEMKIARDCVQGAKVGLGERGPVWWSHGAPDLNRHMVENTQHADW